LSVNNQQSEPAPVFIIHDLSFSGGPFGLGELSWSHHVRKESMDLKGKKGVYAFVNLKNSKLYVGSAFDLRKRLLEHLFSNKTSVVLQRAFKRYGLINFSFIVYEFYEDSKGAHQKPVNLLELENYYIKIYSFDKLYNLKPFATSMLVFFFLV
jgi:hypothetical protein